jgi:hypothetical protein
MDLIDPEPWLPPRQWREQLGPPRRVTRPFRHVPDLLDIRVIDGLPEGKIFVVSGVDPEDILPGETRAEALARLGRVVVVDVSDPAV